MRHFHCSLIVLQLDVWYGGYVKLIHLYISLVLDSMGKPDRIKPNDITARLIGFWDFFCADRIYQKSYDSRKR